MSTTLAPPTSPSPTSAGGGSPAEPSGAPPGADFAPLLAAVQEPPGAGAKPTTRTADAEGDQAGSDSSAPTQDPDAAAIALSVEAALALSQVPGPPSPPAAGPVSGPARHHGAAASSTPATGSPTVAAPPVPAPDAASAPTVALLNATLVIAAPANAAPANAAPANAALASATLSKAPAPPAAQAPAPGPAGAPVAGQSPQSGQTLQATATAPQTASVPAPQAAPADQAPEAVAPPAPPAQAVSQTGAQQQSVSPAGGAVAALSPLTPAQTAVVAAAVPAPLAQVNGVTPSKGGDARRSRDEAGVAEQPLRLAPAANESSAAQTVAPQDASSANDIGAAASAPQAQPQVQPSVRLAELAKAAQTAISVTSQSGGTTARIVLHPAELGSVQIHLRYSSDGVTATIRADSPQAAQVLHEAAPDLRRALEGQGLSLLDLDVHDQSGGSPADRDPGSTGGNAGSAPDVPEDSETLTGVALDPAYLPSPGSQIDVLA
jgi:flagellar hook-length control protein FliK